MKISLALALLLLLFLESAVGEGETSSDDILVGVSDLGLRLLVLTEMVPPGEVGGA